jgi:tRNA A-37 threonylcarbamoyl transferase component Bud32
MANLLEYRCGDVRWLLRPECAGELDRLFGPKGLRLDEWLGTGAGTIVKQAPHRTLYRVVLPAFDFHLKHYPIGGRRAWLRGLVRPARARLEYDRTQALLDRGVPTCEPLAVGEIISTETHQHGRLALRAAGSASYLITRTVPDSVALTQFLEQPPAEWPAARRARFRQRLAGRLGELLARMHDAGVTHHDLHPGNILLRLGADDEPHLYLIDTLMVRLRTRLTPRAARDNLVILNRWFALRSQRSDRLRFWLAYTRARTQETQSLRDRQGVWATVHDLERRTLRSNLRFWRSHDDRCVEDNRWYRRFHIGTAVGHAVADLDQAALASVVAGGDAWRQQGGACVLKESATSEVVAFSLSTASGPVEVVAKRFAAARWSRLAALFRCPPALRSYVLGNGLRLRCLPTPRPLAVWHQQRNGLSGEDYLLTERVPAAVDLKAFVDQLARLPACERQGRLRRLIDQGGRLLRLLHERHLSHRDLKAANLLVSTVPAVVTSRGIAAVTDVAADGGDHLWFIDLVGVRRHGKLRRLRKVRDLARLHASFHDRTALTRTDKLRFLRMYLRWGLDGRQGWKRWWQEIAAATKAKVQRNLRNRRHLG